MRRLFCLLALLAFTSAARPASAVTVLEDESRLVEVFGWTRVAYAVQNGGGETANGPLLGLARLGARAEHKRWGLFFLQFEGASGSVELLDLQLDLRPIPQLILRMGYYRNPLSADVQVPIIQFPFYRRSLLVSSTLAPVRLLGGEIIGQFSVGEVHTALQLGIFQPAGAPLNSLVDGIDRMLVLRGLVELPVGLSAHLAVSNTLGDDFDFGPDDVKLDAAVFYRNAQWFAQAEALFVLRTARSDKSKAFYVFANYAIPIADTGFEIAPGARYEFVDLGTLSHRITTAVDFKILGNQLYVSANLSVQFPRELANNIEFFVYLQAGF